MITLAALIYVFILIFKPEVVASMRIIVWKFVLAAFAFDVAYCLAIGSLT